MSCGADTEAKALLGVLLDGKEIEIPVVDLASEDYKLPSINKIREPVAEVEDKDLTTMVVNGTGTFDRLMQSVSAHLKIEYETNRITGAEYTKAYTALVAAAMSNAVQFVLQKNDAFWKGQLSQIDAIKATLGLEQSKADYARSLFDAHTSEANYGLTMLKMSSESQSFCLGKNELEVVRPLQASGLTTDNSIKTYNLSSMLPQQLANLVGQEQLIKEQMESARAQTMETRSDGVPVTGSVGKQKLLYGQQITSYQRDAEVKAAKLFTDSWITQKTIDEGLLAPPGFQNASIDQVLTVLKVNNGFS